MADALITIIGRCPNYSTAVANPTAYANMCKTVLVSKGWRVQFLEVDADGTIAANVWGSTNDNVQTVARVFFQHLSPAYGQGLCQGGIVTQAFSNAQQNAPIQQQPQQQPQSTRLLVFQVEGYTNAFFSLQSFATTIQQQLTTNGIGVSYIQNVSPATAGLGRPFAYQVGINAISGHSNEQVRQLLLQTLAPVMTNMQIGFVGEGSGANSSVQIPSNNNGGGDANGGGVFDDIEEWLKKNSTVFGVGAGTFAAILLVFGVIVLKKT